MQEYPATIRNEIAKEIIEFLKDIFDARNRRRAKIFAHGVAPVMDKMRTAHTDFLRITSILIGTIDIILPALEINKNDIQAEVGIALSAISETKQLREKGRVERREMFEDVRVMQHKFQEGDVIEKVTISKEEAMALSEFYGKISMYFMSDSASYGHDIPHLINAVISSFERMQRSDGFQSNEIEYLSKTNSKIQAYQGKLENTWGEIAKNYSMVRHLK